MSFPIFPFAQTFSEQLKRIIVLYHPTLSSVAQGSGIHIQSLSRFMRCEPGKPIGLESRTLERLWAYLEVWIEDACVDRYEGETFGDQFRSAIESSVKRPCHMARVVGVSPSVLSLFMQGKRKGMSIFYIDKIWEHLSLEVGWHGGTVGFQYADDWSKGELTLNDADELDF